MRGGGLMGRRQFLGYGFLGYVFGLATKDDPSDLPAPQVFVVSLKISGTVAQGIEAEGTFDVRVSGAKDWATAGEAGAKLLEVGKVEVVGVRKW